MNTQEFTNSVAEYSTSEYWNKRTKEGRARGDEIEVLFNDPRFRVMTDRANHVLKMIKPEWTVLDLACGYGRFSESIADNKYTGVDFSEEMIKWAREKYPNKNFVCQNATDHTEKYDCVFEVNSAKVLSGSHQERFDYVESLLSERANKCIMIIEADIIIIKFSKDA